MSAVNWLIYLSPKDASQLPSVCVNMARLPKRSSAELIEQICLLIAQYQQNNPLGLFQNPFNNVETRLEFLSCSGADQSTLAKLITEMYEYCNNPKHLQFDISREEIVSNALEEIIHRQILPFSYNGLVADERGKPSCQFASK